MKIRIYRGAHEIGGSCVEIREYDEAIIIAIGMPLLTDSSKTRKYLSFNEQRKLLPDIPGLYKGDPRRASVNAILISHAHQDHYGFLRFVKPSIPVFVGKAGQELIERTDFIISRKKTRIPIVTNIQSGDDFSIGVFRIRPFLMDHSAFDAHAFLVSSGKKKVFYSGDFRAHGRKKKAFEQFLKIGPENVDALLLEGTTTPEKLKRLVQNLTPKMIIPIHCENPDDYKKYFNNVRVASDEEVIEI